MLDFRDVPNTSLPTVLAGLATKVLGLVSFAAAIVWHGPIEIALFALVLLGLLVSWLAGAPPAFDAAFSLALIFAAWAAVAGWYETFWWLDIAVHLAATGLIAAMAYRVLAQAGAVRPVAEARHRFAKTADVTLITALGLAAGALWEFGEWAGHTYLDGAIQVGYTDTIGDLVSGGLGAALAGMGWAHWDSRSHDNSRNA